ncbi:MAG TPA: CheR family methyltransferase [Alphaproteobacteria bacterium]|nr:CheR family methyltransferase [Alphaproteobacteria bacterium]
MSDAACIAFLQWALPRLDLRWAGFRKVHGQVCKRLRRRMAELGLADFDAYRARLEADPAEWRALDDCCHITISRFFRDRGVFEALRRRVLPDIAARARREGRAATIWSAGCASGEEAYTLKILWDLEVAGPAGAPPLSIVATDIDDDMLERAREGCFAATSVKELPPQFRGEALERVGERFCVRAPHRAGITFLRQDIRSEAPPGPFDLVLCRYLAFTYFTPGLQWQVLARLLRSLRPEGYLAIGTHERLPETGAGLIAAAGSEQIFQRQSAAAGG